MSYIKKKKHKREPNTVRKGKKIKNDIKEAKTKNEEEMRWDANNKVNSCLQTHNCYIFNFNEIFIYIILYCTFNFNIYLDSI